MKKTLRKRGTLLAFALFMIPIAALMAFTVVSSTIHGAGFARQEQLRSQTFYMAEAGLNVAFNLFAANNFSGQTHEGDGDIMDPADPLFLSNPGFPGLTLDGDGWYRWEWNPGDPIADSFTRTGRPESYRFQVLFPDSSPAGHYLIVCESQVGSQVTTHRLEGLVDSALNYCIFDNGDLADFTHSASESISGKVHANGDIYLRPYQTAGLIGVMSATNPILRIYTDELTSGGDIVRHTDLWDQSDDGGRVVITNSSTSASHIVEGAADGHSGKGNAYDSFHPDWASTGANGAISRWDGAVADRALGSKVVSAPNIKTFEAGGYYQSKADVNITSSTSAGYINDVSFYNEAEDRLVHVKEIDLAAMAAAGAWPSNGLLYSEVPVRLVNGQQLPDKLSVASQSTIYVKGDFNKQFPTSGSKSAGTPLHKPVSLMTSDRIYRLTGDFVDKPGPDYPGLLAMLSGAGFPKATDPPLYPGDEVNTLEVNAAMVDGAPPSDIRAWVDDPANSHYIPSTGLNVMGIPMDLKAKQIPDATGKVKVAFPQSEDYLENLQDMKIRSLGSITHLRISRMADFDNSNAGNAITPWITKSFYVPPGDAVDGVFYEYDSNLAAAPGSLSDAPFAPRIAHKVRWSSGR